MINYDPAVIEQFAEALYKQARTLIVRYAVIGGVIAYGVGYYIASGPAARDASTVGLVVAVFGVLMGVMAGYSKAFTLRLQAQQALCQLQIEKNTRGPGAVAAKSA